MDLLVEYGLIDLVYHFLQRSRFLNLKTWSQVRQETVLRSRCDYILGTEQQRFELIGIREMRNFLSDHSALRAHLLRIPTLFHAHYLRVRRAFLIILPPSKELSRADANFQTLETLEPVPPKMKHPPCPLWMSPDSIRFIYNYAALLRNPCHSQNVARGITRAVRRSLIAEYRRRVEEAAT